MMGTVRMVDPERDEDLETVLKMGMLMKQHEEKAGFEWYAEDTTYLLHLAKHLVYASRNPDRYILMVWEDEEGIVGMIVGEILDLEGTMVVREMGVVRMIFVKEGRRTFKVGTDLVMAMEKEFRAREIKVSTANIYVDNPVPIRGLEGLGYEKQYVQMIKFLDKEE